MTKDKPREPMIEAMLAKLDEGPMYADDLERWIVLFGNVVSMAYPPKKRRVRKKAGA